VCDVVVVGGGISGALIADRLTDAGVDVVVIERRDIGEGSTAASTCLLQYEIDTEMCELAERYGDDVAVRAYRAGLEAIDEIEETASRLPLNCEFTRRPSLYLASSARDETQLLQEFRYRQQHGFDVEWWSAATIAERLPFAAPGAILSRGDAEIDALRLTHGLFAQVLHRGGRIYDRTELKSIEADANGVTVLTDRGNLRAKKLVFATGYESGKYLPRSFGNLRSTYAIATEPTDAVKRLPERCLVWETARPYFYLRTTPDNRIVAGGEDTSFSNDHRRDRLLSRKVRRLERRLQEMFPDFPLETACAWAGTFGESPDGLPLIGTPREMPYAYFAMGYGGNGITFSVLAARLIADHFLGRPNHDAEIFGFARLE
jgi:glycine/D-amino acid oxidase-like deaminating enzyme